MTCSRQQRPPEVIMCPFDEHDVHQSPRTVPPSTKPNPRSDIDLSPPKFSPVIHPEEEEGENDAVENPSLFPIHYIIADSSEDSVSSIGDDLSFIDSFGPSNSPIASLEKEQKVADEAAVRHHQVSELVKVNKQIEMEKKRIKVLERRQHVDSELSFLEDRITLASIELEIKKTWDEYDALQDEMDRKGVLGVFGDLRQRTIEKDQQLGALMKQQMYLSKLVNARRQKTEKLKNHRREMRFLVERRTVLEMSLRDHLLREDDQPDAKRIHSPAGSCASTASSSLGQSNSSGSTSRKLKHGRVSVSRNVPVVPLSQRRRRYQGGKADASLLLSKSERLQSKSAFNLSSTRGGELSGSKQNQRMNSFMYSGSKAKKDAVGSLLAF